MNNWVLILGASSGIGAACAKRLAKKGFNIFMDSLGIEIEGDIDYNSINIKF